MPAKSSWLLHISEIRSLLVDSSLPVVDRAVVQKVFGLGRRQAIELMHRFGGYQAGRTFLIERSKLITELDAIAASPEYQMESARREKLASAVDEIGSAQRAQAIRIPVKTASRATRVSTLPAAVQLKPGRLEIEFSGCGDLLAKLYSLALAAAGDYEDFRKISDGTG